MFEVIKEDWSCRGEDRTGRRECDKVKRREMA